MMQLAFCFSTTISWLLLALPLPAYYLGGWKGIGGAEWRGRAMEDSCVPTRLRSAGENKCRTWPMPGIWSCLLCVYPVWVLCGEWWGRAMEDICVPNSLRSGTEVINVGQSWWQASDLVHSVYKWFEFFVVDNWAQVPRNKSSVIVVSNSCH